MTALGALRNVAREAARSLPRAAARLRGGDVATIAGVGVHVRVDPLTPFGAELLRRGSRASEPFLIPLLQWVLAEGATFVDIGAHWGTYAVAAARLVGERGRVLAVEPFDPSFARLRGNARRNRCRNLIAVNVAVGDREGGGYLLSGGGGDNLATWHGTRPRLRGGWLPASLRRLLGLPVALPCRVTTVRRLLGDHSLAAVDLMKIDIEGSECLVFRDFADGIDFVDVLLVELHPPFAGYDCDVELLHRVLAAGRDLFVADAGSGRLESVPTAEAFAASLGRYYFVSVRSGSRFARGGDRSLAGLRWS